MGKQVSFLFASNSSITKKDSIYWGCMKKSLVIVAIFMAFDLLPFDNAHFYRGNFFWGEPRFEREWLTTFDLWVGHGSQLTSRNCSGNKTSLLNIYGPSNLACLASGVPDLDSSTQDAILIAADELCSDGPFGLAQFGGKFSVTEVVLDFKQNFKKGFFTHIHLPIRQLKIDQVGIKDLSPAQGDPNSTTPAWTDLILNLPSVLAHHGLSIGCTDSKGAGDLSWLLGWTLNYQDTKILDYVDMSIQLGVLFPTDKARDENEVFSLSTGYDKHWGLPFLFDASIGIWEWLTVGFNSGVLVLFDRSKTVRMKTSLMQSGFIKLAQGCARIDPGHLSHAGIYVKGDHFNERLSFLVGYSYNKRHRTTLTALDESVFSSKIINSDQMLASWVMHTIHFLMEIDFSKEYSFAHPRLSFFINSPVAGKRIFGTTVGGADFGFDMTWKH